MAVWAADSAMAMWAACEVSDGTAAAAAREAWCMARAAWAWASWLLLFLAAASAMRAWLAAVFADERGDGGGCGGDGGGDGGCGGDKGGEGGGDGVAGRRAAKEGAAGRKVGWQEGCLVLAGRLVLGGGGEEAGRWQALAGELRDRWPRRPRRGAERTAVGVEVVPLLWAPLQLAASSKTLSTAFFPSAFFLSWELSRFRGGPGAPAAQLCVVSVSPSVSSRGYRCRRRWIRLMELPPASASYPLMQAPARAGRAVRASSGAERWAELALRAGGPGAASSSRPSRCGLALAPRKASRIQNTHTHTHTQTYLCI